MTAVDLQRRADKAMYAAKRGARRMPGSAGGEPRADGRNPAVSGWYRRFLTYTRPLNFDSLAQHWGMV